MPKIERHFFVCTNARPIGGKPSCGARGAAEVLTALQEGLGKHPELWGKVAVTPSGCLGPCFEGPTVVVYPEAVWYVGVTARRRAGDRREPPGGRDPRGAAGAAGRRVAPARRTRRASQSFAGSLASCVARGSRGFLALGRGLGSRSSSMV